MQHRRFRLLIAYGILLLPMVVIEASNAVQGTVNSPLSWMSPLDSERATYEAFTDEFGGGDTLLVSWDGCDFRCSELDALMRALRTDPVFFEGTHGFFERVTNGRELVLQIIKNGLSPNKAVRRCRGTLVGPDLATTCVVVTFRKDAVAHRATLVPLIQRAIEVYCGVSARKQHLAGPIIDGLAVDTASERTLQNLAPLSSAVVFFVAVWCLGSWREALIVFFLLQPIVRALRWRWSRSREIRSPHCLSSWHP